jgi:uncharacterized protein (DUF3820 family)
MTQEKVTMDTDNVSTGQPGAIPSLAYVQLAMELFDASIVQPRDDEEFWSRHEFYRAQCDEHELAGTMRPNPTLHCCFYCGAKSNRDRNGRDQHQPDCPRPRGGWRPRCYFCGGITVHSQHCRELHLAWEMKMPFGKHKGTPLSHVPRSYLHWLLRNHVLQDELRIAIEAALQVTDA